MALLEGNGIRENLYHFMWKKDNIFNEFELKINIPDTILIKNR